MNTEKKAFLTRAFKICLRGRFFPVLLIFTGLSFCLIHTPAWSVNETQIKNSVWKIEEKYEIKYRGASPGQDKAWGKKPTHIYIRGAAVALSPRYALTAFHVLHSLLLRNDYNFEDIRLTQESDSRTLNAKEILWVSAEKDLVLFEIQGGEFEDYLQIRKQDFDINKENFTLMAYPKGIFWEMKRNNGIYVLDDYSSLYVNFSALYGTGGGPLVDKKGEIVGIVTLASDGNLVPATYGKDLQVVLGVEWGCSGLTAKNCMEQEIDRLKDQAQLESAKAQYMLALMLSKGESRKRDLPQARRLFEKAALQGLADAQYNWAMILYRGEEGKQNLPQARHWLEQAANQGHKQAQYMSALMLSKGEGGVKDLSQARHWLKRAAEQGHKQAQYKLEQMFPETDSKCLKTAEDLTKHGERLL